jgi:hypothetical protein
MIVGLLSLQPEDSGCAADLFPDHRKCATGMQSQSHTLCNTHQANIKPNHCSMAVGNNVRALPVAGNTTYNIHL